MPETASATAVTSPDRAAAPAPPAAPAPAPAEEGPAPLATLQVQQACRKGLEELTALRHTDTLHRERQVIEVGCARLLAPPLLRLTHSMATQYLTGAIIHKGSEGTRLPDFTYKAPNKQPSALGSSHKTLCVVGRCFLCVCRRSI